MRILWAILAAVTLSGAAQAGTLTRTDSPHCSARFEGQIVKGDFALFQDMIPRLQQTERKEYEFGNAGICLNSPGGSMLEATRIATYLEDQRIGTVIEDGDTCLSACSIMFMLGADDEASTLNTEIVGNRILLEFDRKMHMNATLYNYASLQRGESSGRLFGSEQTQQACYDACSAYANDPDAHRSGTSEVAQAIQSCFDNDAIWWSVTLRDGTTGYASAKYLR